MNIILLFIYVDYNKIMVIDERENLKHDQTKIEMTSSWVREKANTQLALTLMQEKIQSDSGAIMLILQ